MKKSVQLLFVSTSLLVVVAVLYVVIDQNKKNLLESQNSATVIQSNTNTQNQINKANADTNENINIANINILNASESGQITKQPIFSEPVKEFKQRITKKPFGIYITPATSPVQPEKFTGYHTAVDVEFTDVSDEVSVIAIADGDVVFSGHVSGYGGVVITKHVIPDNETVLALFGHLDNSRSVKKGSHVSRDDVLGYLGNGGTAQTDYERKHLHFGIIKGESINYRGYVATENALDAWYDPMTFYQ